MKRRVSLLLDTRSWAPDPVPLELRTKRRVQWFDVRAALIQTAICTRPPTNYGFDLGDYWAWLRYIPAIAPTAELRLRKEWRDVDPHQKTVLSDELGIGFSTRFITRAFKCGSFADTLYVLRVLLPGRFQLGRSAKIGPQKSPDYIARSSTGDYIVLECKGTQSSQTSLVRSMERGKEQKASLRARRGTRIRHSLVAGLFIPQWFSKEGPCIRVADPSWESLDAFLVEQPPERIDDAIIQISLAKELALAGLVSVPAELSASPVGEHRRFSDVSRRELEVVRELFGEEHRIVADLEDFRVRLPRADTRVRATLSVRVPRVILDQLVGTDSVAEVVANLRMRSHDHSWVVRTEELTTEVTTPLGFSFRLDVRALDQIS